MFWSKKKIDDDKEKQIKDLKLVFPSLRRPNNDDALFELKFVVDNQYSSLRIFIPADFPMTRPVLQVAGPVTHPWLDRFKQVNGCEKLINWSKNSSLVEVVEESMSALLTGVNAPSGSNAAQLSSQPSVGAAPLTSTNSTTTAYSNNPAAGYSSYGNPVNGMTIQQAQQYNQQLYGANPAMVNSGPSALSISHPVETVTNKPSVDNNSSSSASASAANGGRTPISMPTIPSYFPELEKMTDLQLERLLNDEVAFEANLSKVASIEAIRQLCDQLKESNNDNASRNLILEGDISLLQKKANELHDELKTLSIKYNLKLADLSKQFGTSKADVMAELNKKKDALDNKSEELGRSFVDGKIELSAFVQDYLEVRTNYHNLCSKLSVTQ